MTNEVIDETYVHLVVGGNTANLLRETLKLLGRDEEIIAVSDALAMGPLTDIDEGARSRVEWWTRLGVQQIVDAQVPDEDDRGVWDTLRNDPRDVMLWSSAHPDEHLFALRACWQFRDSPTRLHEVVMTNKLHPRVSEAFARLGILGPNDGIAHWSDRAKVVDVDERASRWEAIRSREGLASRASRWRDRSSTCRHARCEARRGMFEGLERLEATARERLGRSSRWSVASNLEASGTIATRRHRRTRSDQ